MLFRSTGVYMGIFNMMIVIPMLLIAVTLPFYYEPLMGGDPRHVLTMCGILMFAAAAAVFTVRATNRDGLPLGASAQP